jgi:hypothetical protein
MFSLFCQGTKLWIIMEYLGGGSALDLMKAGSLEEVNIFSQVGNNLVEWWPAIMGLKLESART